MNRLQSKRSSVLLIIAGLNALVIGALMAGSVAPNLIHPASPTPTALRLQREHGRAALARQAELTPRAAFENLQARGDGALNAQWNPITGVPEWITTVDPAKRVAYTPTAAERGNPLAIARGFLDENRALFKLGSAASEFELLRLEPDLLLGFSHVRLDQRYKGLRVFGRQLAVHLDPDERIVAVGGQYAPHISVDTTPTLTKAEAEALAIDDLLKKQLAPDEAKRVTYEVYKHRTELMVYVDGGNKATLAWRVKLLTKSPLGEWNFFVNAGRPIVFHHIQFAHPIMRRQTFSARNSTNIPGRLMIDEGERSRDPIAQAAHDGAKQVYDYYFTKFKRDSIDGQGMPLVSTVNYGSDPGDAENAAWIGEEAQMIYGDGGRIFKPLPYGLDVVGHEFTHGVINTTADLIYEGQSGALNESYADVFGALIDRGNWDIGETVIKSPPYPTRSLRSMSDPNLGGNYDASDPLGGVGQPMNMRQYANLPISRRADNGGVHINSGIPNHAAYLIAQAIGPDKTEQIYYRALTQYLNPRSNFLQAANATLRAAQDLYSQTEADAVRNAFNQIGINIGGASSGPQAPSAQTTPQRPPAGQTAPQAPLPAGCTNVIADGGFESGQSWVEESKGRIIDPELPHSGQRSAWLGGTDQETTQFIYQQLKLPANGTTVELNFNRLIHEEKSGGILGGLFGGTEDAKFSVLVANERGDLLGAIEQYSSTQGDDNWVQERYDVSELAGKTIRLMFAAENKRGNISSLFVDDVNLLACTTGQGPAAPQTAGNLVYGQGAVTDADTGRGIYGAQVFILKPGISATQAAADDNVTTDEVVATGTTDQSGLFRTDKPIERGQTYSAIIIARGYRPIIADNGVQLPGNATNPYPIDASMRKSR